MINLLPTATREDILYARRNALLVKWMVAVGIGLVVVGIIVVFGQFFINKSIQSYQSRATLAQEQLKIQKVDETQKRVEEISASLKLVVQVLGKEILFSKLIQQIGSAMPEGASLSNLSINKTQGGIDLDALAKNYQTASQIQVNLQDPANKIFEKADIINITCSPGAAADPAYPCTITLRALFAKDNPFLFIHDGVKS